MVEENCGVWDLGFFFILMLNFSCILFCFRSFLFHCMWVSLFFSVNGFLVLFSVWFRVLGFWDFVGSFFLSVLILGFFFTLVVLYLLIICFHLCTHVNMRSFSLLWCQDIFYLIDLFPTLCSFWVILLLVHFWLKRIKRSGLCAYIDYKIWKNPWATWQGFFLSILWLLAGLLNFFICLNIDFASLLPILLIDIQVSKFPGSRACKMGLQVDPWWPATRLR